MTSNLHGPLPKSASRGQDILCAFLRTPPSKKTKREHFENPQEDKQKGDVATPSVMDSFKATDVEKSKAQLQKTTTPDSEVKVEMKQTPESTSEDLKTTLLSVKRRLPAADTQPKRQMRVDQFFSKRTN
mmetsp:Transcript_19011/g.27538  ORF Transcript_19011/g.27538 Transcript_19011/m.27538 type:complete len:129 (-) Transcript_19011:184-570(-)